MIGLIFRVRLLWLSAVCLLTAVLSGTAAEPEPLHRNRLLTGQHSGPFDTSLWVGSNYTPAYASNQVQMWHDFRAEVIETELAAARRYYGINTLRVYLHNMAYDAEQDTFLHRIEQFLALAISTRSVRVSLSLTIAIGVRALPWKPSRPSRAITTAVGQHFRMPERKDENLPKFKAYVQNVVRAHRQDKRVLWWEVYNEPNMQDAFTAKLRGPPMVGSRSASPASRSSLAGDDNPQTDIVNAHNYSANFAAWDRQADLNPKKGTVFTEAGARWMAPRPSNGEPCEVIHWLSQRKAAGKRVPGVYLCWELMVGNSNCRWYWGTKPGSPEPTLPFYGLMWPDATPVSLAEAEAIRHYTTGKRDALLFEDFQDRPSSPAGWTEYARSRAAATSLHSDRTGN